MSPASHESDVPPAHDIRTDGHEHRRSTEPHLRIIKYDPESSQDRQFGRPHPRHVRPHRTSSKLDVPGNGIAGNWEKVYQRRIWHPRLRTHWPTSLRPPANRQSASLQAPLRPPRRHSRRKESNKSAGCLLGAIRRVSAAQHACILSVGSAWFRYSTHAPLTLHRAGVAGTARAAVPRSCRCRRHMGGWSHGGHCRSCGRPMAHSTSLGGQVCAQVLR